MKLCRYCKKYYPESDFGVALTTKNKIYRRHKCRYCYRKTKKDLWKKYQKWLNDYKKQHECSQCKNKDYRVLEFHHVQDKDIQGSLCTCRNHSFKKIKNEVKKCILLCANCHRILHHQERINKFNVKAKSKLSRCNISSKMLSYNNKRDTKICKYCKKYYPESDFYISKSTKKKIYHRHKCKYCYHVTKQKLKKKRQQWLDAFKKKSVCTKCKFNDYRALEFHHLYNKKFNISTGLNKDHLSLECIKKELDKCILLCTNCHKVLHKETKQQKQNGL